MGVRAAIAGCLALGLGGCNTPSVPLPPPDLPAITISASPDNLVFARGAPSARHARVRFYVLDQTSGDGVITTAAADGSFATRSFAGVTGDLVAFYYDTPDGERSDVLCAALQLDVGLISTRCH